MNTLNVFSVNFIIYSEQLTISLNKKSKKLISNNFSSKFRLNELNVLTFAFTDWTLACVASKFFAVSSVALLTHHYVPTTQIYHTGLVVKAEFALFHVIVLTLPGLLLGFLFLYVCLVIWTSVGDILILVFKLFFFNILIGFFLFIKYGVLLLIFLILFGFVIIKRIGF